MSTDKYRFVDPATLAAPIDGLATNYVNRWWAVDAEGRIAFFQFGKPKRWTDYNHPQCNSRREIVEALAQSTWREWAVRVVQLPLVSVPVQR